MFIDRVTLQLVAGKGGDGVVAWRREKYIPKGGPCGGDGGIGGSVYFIAESSLYSLESYRNRQVRKAENGVQGGANRRHGRKGKDLVLKVPLGTLIKNGDEILADLTEEGQQFLICRGGKGGKGNDHFKSPTNRAPAICTPGKPGEEKTVECELKLIADVGLVGFPNAGKSTLITQLADVKVKIAPYPFTTLYPNLGVIHNDDYTKIFIADIPGIIEGAHDNRGLGLEFLRHIERTKLLLFVLDASGIDGRTPLEDYQVLSNELTSYNPALLERPYLVILNKIDTPESATHLAHFHKKHPCPKSLIHEVSATDGTGLPQLLSAIRTQLVEC
ncbi:MAG: GTPase ObgE [Chlamydiia bacterium]|nr:GTPase ObgE [Chlamydiia bacterium]